MITKKGSYVLAVPMHIAQNMATKKLLNNKTFHKALWEKFYNGMTGNQIVSKDGARLVKGLGPAIPEVKILANEAQHIGAQVRPHLRGAQPDLRTLVQLRRLANSRFDKLTKRPLNEAELDMASAMFSKAFPGKNAEEFRSLLQTLTPEKAQALQELSKQNPLTGQLLKGIADRSHMPSPTSIGKNSILESRANKVYGIPAEIGINGALAAVDPFTAGVNATKRVLFNRQLGEKFNTVKKLQDKSNDILLNKPMEKAFNNGVDSTNPIKKFYNKVISPNVVNPLNAYAVDFAGGVGNIKKMK